MLRLKSIFEKFGGGVKLFFANEQLLLSISFQNTFPLSLVDVAAHLVAQSSPHNSIKDIANSLNLGGKSANECNDTDGLRSGWLFIEAGFV